MVDEPGHHCKNRLFEWTMALAMTAFGIHVLLLPHTLSVSRYAGVLFILTSVQFALVCIIVGFTRIVSLSANGFMPVWGPRLRSITAIFAAIIWLQLAVALGQSARGTPSPGMWIYLALMGAEFVSVVRARRDGNGFG